MASVTEPETELLFVKKVRKSNFTASEITTLTERVEESLELINSNFTNSITNKRKAAVWSSIADAVNSVGNEKRTVKEVKDKWKNLSSTAKKEFHTFKKESKVTGGGPAPKTPSVAAAKVIELLGDTPQFSGLDGFETGFETVFEVKEDEESVPSRVPENSREQPALIIHLSEETDVLSGLSVKKESLDPQKINIKKRKVTQSDVLEEQYKALKIKQENMALKKKKLELEILLLERKLQ